MQVYIIIIQLWLIIRINTFTEFENADLKFIAIITPTPVELVKDVE